MIANVIAAIWMLLGTFWFLKPDSLRNRLTRKMTRGMKRVVVLFAVVFGFSMIGSVIKAPGTLSKVVAIAAFVLTIKLLLLFTSKTSEKFSEFWKR